MVFLARKSILSCVVPRGRNVRGQFTKTPGYAPISRTPEYYRKRYERDREKILERCGRYYRKNKDKIRAYHEIYLGRTIKPRGPKFSRKEYREANKDKINKQAQARRAVNREERNAQARGYYRKHRMILIERSKKNYEKDKQAYVDRKRLDRQRTRDRVIEGLGGKCSCCGEPNRGFLTLDHVNGQGLKHVKSRGGQHGVMKDVIKSGFDKTRFCVLCFNCNCGRERNNGICPHKKPFTVPVIFWREQAKKKA